MKLKDMHKSYDVGVIIGRFQVNTLTKGHRDLIRFVCDRHDKVIIVLGIATIRATKNNPLDFQPRQQMLKSDIKSMSLHDTQPIDYHEKVTVLYLNDDPSDEVWSKGLDSLITANISTRHTAVLYGSRDSFIKYYTGKYPTEELEQEVYTSGNEERKKLALVSRDSPDFRAGVIYATMWQYPVCYPTVDIAIWNNEKREKLLLGRKANENKYRFIGGFVEPGETFERAAKREASEEAKGLELDNFNYLGSFVIDDWRYRKETDKITTAFFEAFKIFGNPEPNDDIVELKWFDFLNSEGFLNIEENMIVDSHHVLFQALVDKLHAKRR